MNILCKIFKKSVNGIVSVHTRIFSKKSWNSLFRSDMHTFFILFFRSRSKEKTEGVEVSKEKKKEKEDKEEEKDKDVSVCTLTTERSLYQLNIRS